MHEHDTTDPRKLASALVIGGTGFVGRHTVVDLVAHGYDVTTMSRGEQPIQFDENSSVDHITGDRSDQAVLRDTAQRVDPDLVVDGAAFYPGDVRTATEIFADDAVYVYVSSGGVYAAHEIPKREDETSLHDYTSGQATDDSMATYGPRKAECDRETAAAADRGLTAMSVRPTMVYGPKTIQSSDGSTAPAGDEAPSWAEDLPGLQDHHDYWIDRVVNHDRVVVPGDGTAIWHRAYVEDVASAIRIVAERGEPGEAYNVADRRVCTMEDVIDLIADALDTSVTVVHASERELARVGLDPDDFVLYHHLGSRYPHVLDTCKLASLGWRSTPVERSIERTVEEAIASDRTGEAFDPGRDIEERFLDEIAKQPDVPSESAKTMHTDAHKRTVKRYPQAVAAGDFHVIEEICTETVVNHTPLADVEGYAALKEYESRIHEAFPGFDVSFEDLLVEGDRVAMRLKISGVHQGPMMDIEPTGKEVTFENTIFHRMEDGLIAERWVQPDIFGILVQLGAVDRSG